MTSYTSNYPKDPHRSLHPALLARYRTPIERIHRTRINHPAHNQDSPRNDVRHQNRQMAGTLSTRSLPAAVKPTASAPQQTKTSDSSASQSDSCTPHDACLRLCSRQLVVIVRSSRCRLILLLSCTNDHIAATHVY